MATLNNHTPLFQPSYTPAADVTAGMLIGLNDQEAAAGAKIKGVAAYDADSGWASSYISIGIVECTSSAAIAAGADLEAAASSKVVTLSTGKKIGMALQAASGANQKILCMIIGV